MVVPAAAFVAVEQAQRSEAGNGRGVAWELQILVMSLWLALVHCPLSLFSFSASQRINTPGSQLKTDRIHASSVRTSLETAMLSIFEVSLAVTSSAQREVEVQDARVPVGVGARPARLKQPRS
jgi:hypothetical protein